MEGGSPSRFTQLSSSSARELMHESRASDEGVLAQRHLNRLRWPLLRLPPEILSVIVYAAVIGTRSDLKNWIHYGHICHDFRVALLGMHTLWADVVFDAQYAHLLEELLARAGYCPLTIELGPKSAPHVVDRALEILPRARKLNAYGLSADQMKAILRALKQGALRWLADLRLGWKYGDPLWLDNYLAFSSPPELIIPTLHTLFLLDMFIPFDTSSLRVLSLTWDNTRPMMTQDSLALVNMLRCCEMLESLTLCGWTPERDTIRGLRQTILLPRLIHLELHQELDRVLALWTLLSIPASASVSVSLPHEGWLGLLEGVLDLPYPLRAFLPHTQIDGISKISKISTFYNQRGLLGVRLGSVDNLSPSNVEPASIAHQISTTPWNWETSLAFSFSLYSDIKTPDEAAIFLHHVCMALELPMDGIDTLECSLSNYSEFAVENEHNIYTKFPAVTTLQLNNSERDDVDIGFVLGSLSPHGRNYFPTLQALHIARKFSSTDIDRILDAVKKRVDDGWPLRVLTLSGQFSGQESGTEVEQRFEQLQSLVPLVRFDVSRC